MYFPHVGGLIIFLGALLLMVLTVPWDKIKKLALFGLVCGLGTGIALIVIMQNWYGFWIYHKVDFLYFMGIPLILSAAWTPVEIFFAYFLSRYQHPILNLLLIGSIPAVAVGIHFLQIANQMLTYHHHWTFLKTYVISLGIHLLIALYLKQFYKIRLV